MSSLAYDLHVLVRALDRSAEARLTPFGLTYQRYLALVVVGAASGLTQRELAASLGQTEATASRTASALAEAGWLEATRSAGAGNRRALSLTASGQELLARAGERLGDDFDEVVRGTGQDPDLIAEHVRGLTALIEASP